MQPSPLTRRRFLTIFGLSAVGVLATACGSSATPTTGTGSTGTGASTAPASSVPASTAPAASAAGSSTAPSAAGGAVVSVTWFAGRDPSGFTAKQIEKFNAPEYRRQDRLPGAGRDDDRPPRQVRDRRLGEGFRRRTSSLPTCRSCRSSRRRVGQCRLDAARSAPSERAQFFQGTLDGATYDSKIYAMPWYNNGPGLFYRKDTFQAAGVQAPKTYDEMLAAAKTVQTPDMAGYRDAAGQPERGRYHQLDGIPLGLRRRI